jgi:hypothetical protein
MKEIKSIVGSFLLALLLAALNVGIVSAKEGPQRIYMYLNYFNDSGETYLEAQLKYKVNKEFKLLEGVQVNFYSLDNEDEAVKIASFMTNEEGKAICKILKEMPIYRDETGLMQFSAKYKGSKEYKKAAKSLEAKEIELNLHAVEVDSVKSLKVEAFEIISDTFKIPITDVSVLYNVKRLFGDMIIGEENIRKGKAILEFPSNIPGDQEGRLFLSARISNHDIYGTVRAAEEVNWGIPVSYVNEELPRALWSKAPLWMIISMIVVLVGAWYHYFLALFKLFKIKKS